MFLALCCSLSVNVFCKWVLVVVSCCSWLAQRCLVFAIVHHCMLVVTGCGLLFVVVGCLAVFSLVSFVGC